MEPLKPNFAKIVGTPKEGRDSWIIVEDGLFLVLEISGPGDFPVAQRGREIIASLTYGYQNLPKKNLANLEELLKGVKTEEGVNLSLILGAQTGKVFYLVCRGGGKVILRRQGKFGTILATDGSASGILEDKDIFLLVSPRFNEVVSLNEVKSVFDHFSPAELAEGLTPLVHRAEDTSGVACLILQFEKIEEEEWGEETEKIEKEKPGERISNGKLISKIRYLSSIIRKPPLYLRTPQDEEEKKKRIVFWVVIILAILLGVSIVFGLMKKVKTQKESRFRQTYEVSLHQYEEGKALAGLNNLRATTLLNEAKASLKEIQKDFGKNSKEAGQISELLSKIDQELATASQVYKITPEVFLDLGLVKEGAEGRSLKLFSENLIVLDSKNSSLYQINIKSKSAKILAGGEDFRGSGQIAISDGVVYVLTEKGIVKCQMSNGKCQMAIDKDSEWGEIVDMESFGSNLYLLDKTKNQIWKYIGGEAGFSEKTRYLTSDRVSNLQNFSSMAIDGSVWLTTDRVLKFTQGKQDRFEMQGLEKPLGSNLLIFTSNETKDLYVLDKTNNRLVVLEKTGTYKSQYVWEEMGKVADFVVSEEEKKIFLLEGSKIYSIQVKIKD